MSIAQIAGSVLMAVGVALSLISAWGLLDFPSAMARMHAATKAASLGLALVAIGAGVSAESLGLVGVGILVAIFLFLTAPISGHMLGRAAYAAGQAPGLVHDDLAAAPRQSMRFEAETRSGPSLLRVIPLGLVWVLLWRDASPGVWLGGVAVAVLVELVRRSTHRPRLVRAGAFLRFIAAYVWTVALSNIRVAWEVVTPRNDQIREAIVAVPLQSDSTPVALLVANAISYTPGSLTVELTQDPLVLYVHVLHFESVDEVRSDVARLERLVASALGVAVPV